ncbi:hypothetical protein EVAR_86697_1 [Eumeta japonica]|uniref:Uncharacterized protein n=1 Tax=Eumeta variegata TaxID=151549 RepID=A0A4C1XVD9_EUMVA|nr:hypothetical protein EVAR_86697_1 [Eumeta japonica]
MTYSCPKNDSSSIGRLAASKPSRHPDKKESVLIIIFVRNPEAFAAVAPGRRYFRVCCLVTSVNIGIEQVAQALTNKQNEMSERHKGVGLNPRLITTHRSGRARAARDGHSRAGPRSHTHERRTLESDY